MKPNSCDNLLHSSHKISERTNRSERLQESILPTLLPAIHEMMGLVDSKGYPQVPTGREMPPPSSFNPIRWLAQASRRARHSEPTSPRPLDVV